MRLEPIEKPRGLLMRAAYLYSRMRMGRVTTPLQVLFARAPKLARVVFGLSQAEEKKLSIDRGISLLIHAQSSAINGCGFCVDIGRALAVQEHLGLDKFDAIADYRESPLFSDRERAALAYTEAVTRSKHVPDATFEALRKHWNEREIVELTYVNAVANFHNLMNLPLELESDGLCSIALKRAQN